MLEDDAEVRSCARIVSSGAPFRSMLPEVGSMNPAMRFKVVVLPDPEGPEEREKLAGSYLEVDVVHGDRVAIGLGEALKIENCLVSS